MSKGWSTLVVLLLCVLPASAQQTYLDHLQTDIAGRGTVRVVESIAIDTILSKKINLDELAKANRETTRKKELTADKVKVVKKTDEETDEDSHVEVDTSKKVVKNAFKTTGYRVQVYAGGNSRDDKNKAEKIGNDIKHLFPEQPVYVHFYSPRWICRVGNFRTYEDAQEILTQVRAAGYKQANIVKGTITITN